MKTKVCATAIHMKGVRKVLCMLLSAAMVMGFAPSLALTFPSKAYADEVIAATISTTATDLNVDDEFTVSVSLSGADLSAAGGKLVWDSTALELESITAGEGLSTDASFFGTTSGARAGLFTFYANTATTTAGIVVATYTFKALTEGASTISGSGFYGVKRNSPSDVAISSPDSLSILVTALSGITLNEESLSLVAGGEAILEATLSPAGATGDVTWSSSNADVATVDENGSVTAVAVGTAIITAACGGFSDTCTVTVTAADALMDGDPLDAVLIQLPIDFDVSQQTPADLRFAFAVDALGYKSAGLLLIVGETDDASLRIGGSGVHRYSTQNAYQSIYVNGVLTPVAQALGTSRGWAIAVKMTGVPAQAFSTAFTVRGYVERSDGSIVYGPLRTFSVDNLAQEG